VTFVVTVRHHLRHEIIASSRETGAEVVAADVQGAVATAATTAVDMVDHTEGRHRAQIGGATSGCRP